MCFGMEDRNWEKYDTIFLKDQFPKLSYANIRSHSYFILLLPLQ
jgi:hypothetical protein